MITVRAYAEAFCLVVAYFSLSASHGEGVSKVTSEHQYRNAQCGLTQHLLKEYYRDSNSKGSVSISPPEKPTDVTRDREGRFVYTEISESSDLWKGDWDGERPSTGLVRAWLATPWQSDRDCIISTSRELNINIADNHLRGEKVEEFKGAIMQLTKPFFDSSKKRAIVLVSRSGPGIAGNVTILHMERYGSEWRKLGSKIIAVS